MTKMILYITCQNLPDNLSGEEQRNCTVPAGKATLAPLITGSCWDDNTDPKLKTEEGLRECSKEGQEFGVVSATLDGRQLQNLDQYGATSDVFNMTVAEDNAFQSPSGTFPAMGSLHSWSPYHLENTLWYLNKVF